MGLSNHSNSEHQQMERVPVCNISLVPVSALDLSVLVSSIELN